MTTLKKALENWRPPGWQPIEEDVDLTPEENMSLHAAFKAKGYYKSGGTLSKHGEAQADADEAAIVRRNAKLLRDAWNTFGPVWNLGEKLVGRSFLSDPFHNPRTQGLESLEIKLDGSGDPDDPSRKTSGLATSDEVITIKIPTFEEGEVVEVETELPVPLNWRGHGKRAKASGKCPAAVNGPHSKVETWLKLCVAYGQEDICAAFVPDNGDGWFQRWALTAQLVVRLNRIPCEPPPGIVKSSPRGANSLLVWVPKPLVASLPKDTRECITKGNSFKVPLLRRPQAGVQYAFVQPGAVDKVVDFGLVS